MNVSSESSPSEMSPELVSLLSKIGELPSSEEKITFGLSFMRTSISQEGKPRFREFWEARKAVLPLFKENIHPAIRSKLWDEYVELTVEARKVKEILEEQSAFAMEQIELAIAGLEKSVQSISVSGESRVETASSTIREKEAEYGPLQHELNALNPLAGQLNGLRKEVAQTEMRIRFRTKFFKRLSSLGDAIFPKRKTLMDQVSQLFERDVEAFIAKHFQGTQIVGAPYFALREEIKALQAMAKVLTLSSGTFNRTRLKLSECWDKLKVVEKEHKQQMLAKQEMMSEKRAALQKKIEEVGSRAAGMTLVALDKEFDPIVAEMRATRELTKFDVKALRDAMDALRAPHVAEQEARAKVLEEAEREKLRIKKEKIAQFKEKIAHLSQDSEPDFEMLKKELKELDPPRAELQQLDRALRQLKDRVAEEKEKSLLSLNEGDREALQTLKQVLVQKKQRRQELKEQLELHRKALGSSNLDFEKAMQYRELMDQEKELLEKANAGIEEIEQKISELEG